jgi:hypothetical protein
MNSASVDGNAALKEDPSASNVTKGEPGMVGGRRAWRLDSHRGTGVTAAARQELLDVLDLTLEISSKRG